MFPRLILSFEWYSKAWWPRTKIRGIRRSIRDRSPQPRLRQMFDEAFEAVLGGAKTVTQVWARNTGIRRPRRQDGEIVEGTRRRVQRRGERAYEEAPSDKERS